MRLRAFLFLTTAAILAGAAGGGYHVTTKFQIGGEGGWDYATADSDARRLYVSHGTQVEVLDLDSGTMLGSIPDTPGVHGIAVAPDLNRGFISAGRANKIKIFDLKTMKVTGEAPTGRNPDAIIYDPASKRVFAFNGGTANATVIDGRTGNVDAHHSVGRAA